jgi:hypothetical protein
VISVVIDRDNEVKSGSAISERGKRITLKVEDREDLSRESRDILKVIYSYRRISTKRLICLLCLERNGGNDYPGNRFRADARYTGRKIHYC